MIYVKMNSSRVGAAGHCRAGTVHSAEADSQKAETLLAYVDTKAAVKLSKAKAEAALAESAKMAAPVAEGEDRAEVDDATSEQAQGKSGTEPQE